MLIFVLLLTSPRSCSPRNRANSLRRHSGTPPDIHQHNDQSILLHRGDVPYRLTGVVEFVQQEQVHCPKALNSSDYGYELLLSRKQKATELYSNDDSNRRKSDNSDHSKTSPKT